MTATLRSARPDDGEAIQRIDLAAGQRFREVGLPQVADAPPLPIDQLLAAVTLGNAWVAELGLGPVGFILLSTVGNAVHIDQVSVDPEHQGRGIGRLLVEHAGQHARELGLAAVTLTTFADVPWNRPLYQHLGFQILAGEDLGPALRTRLEQETPPGTDQSTRVVMRRDLPAR